MSETDADRVDGGDGEATDGEGDAAATGVVTASPVADADAYGPVRGFVRGHADSFAPVDDALAAAHVPETADTYVARVARETGVGALVGLVCGVLAAALAPDALDAAGVGLVLPLAVRALLVPAGVLAGALAVAGGRLGALSARRSRRARAIDGALPHATLFCYALVHGGTDLYAALDRLGEETDAYGPLAEEIRVAVRDARRFDADLFDALSAARERTPSDDFAVLLDELVSVLETGGDVEAFLADAVTDQRERADARQDRVLEDLETVAETYIVVALAGPAFLFVVVLVASFTASGFLPVLYALTYVGLPLVLLAFFVSFRRLLARTRQRAAAPVVDVGDGGDAFDVGGLDATALRDALTGADDTDDADDGDANTDDADTDDRLTAYREGRERATRRERLRAPLDAVRDRPALVGVVSVPLGVLVAVVGVLAGVVPLSFDATATAPVGATTGLVVAPALVAAAPFAALHVRERRRRRDLRGRFPDALRVVADAASNGVPLADAVSLVAERTAGTLAAELDRVRRDVAWTAEFPRALRAFAGRLGVPDVTRAVGLTVVAVRATDDVGPIVEAVADDLGERHDREVERRRTLGVYAGIVVVGVFVYVGMLAAFDVVFLPAVTQAAASASSSLPAGATGGASAVGLTNVPVRAYRTLFYHSALVQAAGNGLVVGALVGGRVRDGVAYAVPLVAAVAVAFCAFTYLL